MTDCRPTSTPLPPDLKLYWANVTEVSEFAALNRPYQNRVCSLIYVSQCTQPDITYAVSVPAQQMDPPAIPDWNAFIHGLRFLKHTTNLFIEYGGSSDTEMTGNRSWMHPEVFSDKDWAGDIFTRRSTTGYIFKILGGAIS